MSSKLINTCLILSLFALGGCTSISYYAQSVVGHSKLMLAREPIDKAIEKALSNNNQNLAAQLQLAIRIRSFAVTELSLPDNSSYSNYVALEQDFPVYTVVAAPEFSFIAEQWCYVVIGCASYRGYFEQQSANDFAASLAAKGFETSVGGASAYSTLGWFSDPLLPSMMRYGEANLAETLFHELAHQQLYINGDSGFNEAFATVVGEIGTRKWLSQNAPTELAEYQQRLSARKDFDGLIEATRVELSTLYASSQTPELMRVSKSSVFARMQYKYQSLKDSKWAGLTWFDAWFDTPINNARLAAFSTYRERVKPIRELFNDCGKDLDRFYATLAPLKAVDGLIALPLECGNER
ncbi:MAG: putative aminopeptidase [Cryomorphaceae bacterium]|jgi:predicted aminopeptidase